MMTFGEHWGSVILLAFVLLWTEKSALLGPQGALDQQPGTEQENEGGGDKRPTDQSVLKFADRGKRLGGGGRESGRRSDDENLAVQIGAFNRAGKLIGMSIMNLEGEELGKLHDLVLDLDKGKVAYAVLATGGVLGIGEKLLPVPLDRLRIDRKRKGLVLAVERQALIDAKGIEGGMWPRIGSSVWLDSQFWKAAEEESRDGAEIDQRGDGDSERR